MLIDQAKEVVTVLRKKYKTGLITNGKTNIQYGKIDQIGMRNDFDIIIVSEEAGVKKPDPSIFEMACTALDVRSEECIYIGDHPMNDIEGAFRAGMETIWMQANQPWQDGLTAKPLHTIDQLSKLKELL
ncbi:2-haloalkanoic acid dehalogenase [Paenibacillus pini JCM 16418]|uniref:2-haloalkanoic acid dehalogenase n=1 Tax=Paenibacillus pini JCM 16418 TaxID=1236976 RepID=W7YCF2_9BACL|nr:2-haloalkanoic acid dehalogenase [Paenibacillus pini JCM 16418]